MLSVSFCPWKRHFLSLNPAYSFAPIYPSPYVPLFFQDGLLSTGQHFLRFLFLEATSCIVLLSMLQYFHQTSSHYWPLSSDQSMQTLLILNVVKILEHIVQLNLSCHCSLLSLSFTTAAILHYPPCMFHSLSNMLYMWLCGHYPPSSSLRNTAREGFNIEEPFNSDLTL